MGLGTSDAVATGRHGRITRSRADAAGKPAGLQGSPRRTSRTGFTPSSASVHSGPVTPPFGTTASRKAQLHKNSISSSIVSPPGISSHTSAFALSQVDSNFSSLENSTRHDFDGLKTSFRFSLVSLLAFLECFRAS